MQTVRLVGSQNIRVADSYYSKDPWSHCGLDPADDRSRIHRLYLVGGWLQSGIVLELTVSNRIGYGCHYAPNSSSLQWRFPLAFQALPSLVLLAGLFWLPESPRYLIEKDRIEEGMKVLRKLHFNGHNDEWVQTEFAEIRATISAEKAVTTRGWLIMFTVPQWRTRLMHGTLIQVFTQLTGISEFRPSFRALKSAC